MYCSQSLEVEGGGETLLRFHFGLGWSSCFDPCGRPGTAGAFICFGSSCGPGNAGACICFGSSCGGLARPPSTLSFQDEAGTSGIAKPLPRTACEGARPDAQPPPGPHSVSSDSCECKLYWKPSPLLGHSSRKHLATCASWPQRLEICRVDFLDLPWRW